MLDLRLIRERPEEVRAALARRGADAELDRVIALDEAWRTRQRELDELRAGRRAAAESIARARRAGEDAAAAVAAQRELAARERALAEQVSHARAALDRALLTLPNLPAARAAPHDTVERVVGEPAPALGPDAPEGTVRDHVELAGPLIDIEAGTRLSGARFAYLKGDLVLLELALVRWVLGKLGGHGFEPVIPPVLVRERALYGTGMLPDTEQQIYRLADDDLYLVGTSEVALASLHDGEIIEAGRLPLRYAGFSPCFRREAGAAGRDTRGIFRVHQFDKVEMFSFVEPESSPAEHELILSIEEEILGELGLPYRVVNIAVGDLGSSAAIKFDCEAWLPSQRRYRELTSCSNTTDYQARRLDIRVRPAGGGRPRVLHTLNGTAFAVGRTLIALLENGQQPDGTVDLPALLVPFGAPERLGGA